MAIKAEKQNHNIDISEVTCYDLTIVKAPSPTRRPIGPRRSEAVPEGALRHLLDLGFPRHESPARERSETKWGLSR
jgi:hypothetical protein